MKIGVVGTIWLDTPPKGYGGTEEVVANLVNGLSENGHDVTLFGPKTSQVRAKIFPTVDLPLRNQNIEWTNISYTLYHLTEAFDRASDFDILHIQLNKGQDYFALPLSISSKTPVLFTIHFKLPTAAYNKDRNMVLSKYKYLPFTSISDSQREGRDFNFIKTVYNSLDIKKFAFSPKAQDYFVWLGKVNPLKGTKEAILAAKTAGVKLYVMGKIDKGVKQMYDYYEKEVKPLIDNKQIIWVGEVELAQKVRILGGAKAFLNPILWEEPFGLVMAESQAVGTPVISFKRGSAPEVIVDGITGFLVDDIGGMVEKMKIVDKIDRKACRKNVEEKFTIERMIGGYTKAYDIAIEDWKEYVAKQKDYLKKRHELL